MSHPTGSRLGPYEILAPIGAGGMGEVYRARDARLGREVALKTLPEALSSDPGRLARFEQEARSASALNHPNIVSIYDIGSSGRTTYIGMELVSGMTLRETLAEGPLPPRRLLPIAAQIASGLAAAHEAGIVHRDLKPENVMVTRDGRVKILDFGLAKLASLPAAPDGSQFPTASPPTEPGTVMGTVGYMSPEQVRGLPLDARSDIFSFGAVLHEMVSGRRAFRGATGADVMTAILKEDPPELPEGVHPALGRIALRCLEKAPERRFQSARDLGFALESLVETSGPSLSAAVAAAPAPRRIRATGFGLAIVSGAVGFGLAWMLRPATLRSHAPSFARAVRVTSSPAQEFGAAISPDGKWVAYLSNARGPVDVWVKFLAGGEAANLTEKTGLVVQSRSDIGGLDISPDGSLIAFDAGRSAGAPSPEFDSWAVPAPLGGTPRRLVERGRSARWSPDGRRIVYVRAGSSRGDALVVVDADGGNALEILKPQGGRHTHWPAWSRDGRYVYFCYGISSPNREPTGVYRIPSTGGDPEPVVASSRRAVFPAPMPGGGLLYAANPDTADLSLWWRPEGGGPPVRITRGVGEYAEPRVSADGRSVIARLVEAREKLLRLPVTFDGPPSPAPVTNGYLGDFDPAVSPQGDRLVWSSSRSGDRNLWIGAADASGARPLTSGSAFDERPAFSPDGKQVAFVSDRGGERAIWLVSSDGGAPRRLAAAQVLDTLTWSPDGSEIVFAAPAGDLPGLYRVPLADGKVSRLPTPSGADSPAWRPGADEIAYLAIEPPRISPIVRFVDSRGRPLHTERPDGPAMGNGILVWSPSGRRLLGTTDPGATNSVVYVMEPDGTFRKLATLTVGSRTRGAAWSADEASVLVGEHEASSDIVLLSAE